MGRIRVSNQWLVGAAGDGSGVRVMAPPAPKDLLTPDEALSLAAYLVACSGCDMERFRLVLDAVVSS